MADVALAVSSPVQTAAPDHMNLDNLQPANIQTIVVQSYAGAWIISHPSQATQRAVI